MELDESLKNDFLEESKDILDNLKKVSATLLQEKDFTISVNTLFRGVHTIKGGSSMFGLDDVHHHAHELESFMSTIKERKNRPNNDEVKKIRDGLEILEKKLFLPEIKEGIFDKFLDDFKQVIDDLISQKNILFQLNLKNDQSTKIIEILERYKVEKLQDIAIDTHSTAYLFYLPIANLIGDLKSFLEKLENKSILIWTKNNTATQNTTENAPTNQNSIKSEVLRVPLDRINSALDNIWEIYLVRNQISFLMEQNRDWLTTNLSFTQSFENLDNLLRRNISELESKVMSMRMGALDSIFQRMEKIVDAYSKETKKEISFKTTGGKTELDKKVIDMLAEPLTHLIRNAMDHGLESNDTRAKLGKNPIGVIELKANIHETIVTVEVCDDGKGINAQEILESAKRKGIDVSNLKTQDEIIQLIFAPGFSTAKEVTSVSGRGVGMDAVQTSINELGGSVSIQTQVGKGTTFSIAIPLGVAVTSSIIVEINNFLYAISSRDIICIKRISQFDIQNNAKRKLYKFQENFLDCITLDDKFISNYDSKEEGIDTNVSICIIKNEKIPFCLVVDSILHSTELVVRPMPEFSPKTNIISGISILESGRPVFMLSLKGIYNSMRFYD